MTAPKVSYRNLNLLADAARWEDLLAFAATVDSAEIEVRREVAHVVALEAPVPVAVAAAELFPDDDYGFAGPLWEVVAHRPWRELAPHLTHPRTRDLVAYTRVLHGEDLRDVAELGTPESGAPLRLEPWEAEHWDGEWHIPGHHRTGNVGSTVWACPFDVPHTWSIWPAAREPTTRAPAGPWGGSPCGER